MVISNGDWTFLFSTPIAVGLWAFAVLGFLAPSEGQATILGRDCARLRPQDRARIGPDAVMRGARFVQHGVAA